MSITMVSSRTQQDSRDCTPDGKRTHGVAEPFAKLLSSSTPSGSYGCEKQCYHKNSPKAEGAACLVESSDSEDEKYEGGVSRLTSKPSMPNSLRKKGSPSDSSSRRQNAVLTPSPLAHRSNGQHETEGLEHSLRSVQLDDRYPPSLRSPESATRRNTSGVPADETSFSSVGDESVQSNDTLVRFPGVQTPSKPTTKSNAPSSGSDRKLQNRNDSKSTSTPSPNIGREWLTIKKQKTPDSSPPFTRVRPFSLQPYHDTTNDGGFRAHQKKIMELAKIDEKAAQLAVDYVKYRQARRSPAGSGNGPSQPRWDSEQFLAADKVFLESVIRQNDILRSREIEEAEKLRRAKEEEEARERARRAEEERRIREREEAQRKAKEEEEAKARAIAQAKADEECKKAEEQRKVQEEKLQKEKEDADRTAAAEAQLKQEKAQQDAVVAEQAAREAAKIAPKQYGRKDLDDEKANTARIISNLEALEARVAANPALTAPLKMTELRRAITPKLGQVSDDRDSQNEVVRHSLHHCKSEEETKQWQAQQRLAIQNVLRQAAADTPEKVPVNDFLYRPVEGNILVPIAFILTLHHLGIKYVQQAELEVSADLAKADPVGIAVTTSLAAQEFCVNGKSFIDIIVARVLIKCPILLCELGPEVTEGDRHRLGWEKNKESPDQWESEGKYMGRMEGLAASYVAICGRDWSTQKDTVHPYPNFNLWHLVSMMINLPMEKLADAHFHIMKAIVLTITKKMVAIYGIQGKKLMHCVFTQWTRVKENQPMIAIKVAGERYMQEPWWQK